MSRPVASSTAERPAGAALPSAPGVIALVERQAAAHAGVPAVICGERSWTNKELNQFANRLARLLIARGVGPDVCVGVGLDRSFEMVAAVLAVFKAGGAYVPLDPNYPRERLALMLTDCAAPVPRHSWPPGVPGQSR